MKTGIYLTVLLAAIIATGVASAGTSGPSPIPNPPTFTVSSNLTTLCKGTTNYVPITIANLGNKNPSFGMSNPSGTVMQYVGVTLLRTPSLIPTRNGTSYIGVIYPLNSSTVYLPIFVAANASLLTTVGINVNYQYLLYYADSENRNITFEVQSCKSPLSVSVTPTSVTSGEIQNLSLSLANTGSMALNSIVVHFGIPSIDGAVIGSSQIQISSLPSDSKYNSNISIFVSRNASIESFPFNLTATFYSSGGSIEQVSNSTSLIPTGSIDLLTSGLTVTPTSVQPGGIASISFTLTDIGTSGASAVSVDAITPLGFSAFGSNPVYVGDISADSQSPVTVSLSVNSTVRPGEYTIPLVISYLNDLRQNITETDNVTVTVSGLSGAVTTGGSLSSSQKYTYKNSGLRLVDVFVVILIAALIVVVYFFARERIRGKRHAERRA